MSTIEAEYAGLMMALEDAIPDVLEHEIADLVKESISEQTYPNVYDAYTPRMWSRRGKSGGLADTKNMVALVNGKELVVRSEVPLQGLFAQTVAAYTHSEDSYFRTSNGVGNHSNLAVIVENGDKRYHMPFPRPYHESAENDVRGKAEKVMQEALISALHARGY